MAREQVLISEEQYFPIGENQFFRYSEREHQIEMITLDPRNKTLRERIEFIKSVHEFHIPVNITPNDREKDDQMAEDEQKVQVHATYYNSERERSGKDQYFEYVSKYTEKDNQEQEVQVRQYRSDREIKRVKRYPDGTISIKTTNKNDGKNITRTQQGIQGDEIAIEKTHANGQSTTHTKEKKRAHLVQVQRPKIKKGYARIMTMSQIVFCVIIFAAGFMSGQPIPAPMKALIATGALLATLVVIMINIMNTQDSKELSETT